MGKVGYLPDISGNFVHWRMKYLDGIDTGNWGMVSLGLHNMNGSLDIDYRLPVSTDVWKSKQDGYVVWECGSCTEIIKQKVNEGEEDEQIIEKKIPTRSKRSEVLIFKERNNLVISLLTKRPSRKLWVCPKCKTVSSVSVVKAKLMKYPEPHFRTCIYSEPVRPMTGLQRRRGTYPREMIAWSKTFSKELEHQLALYRLEYVRVNGKDMDDTGGGYVDKGGN